MDAVSLLSGDARAFQELVWASRVHVHHTDPGDLVGLLSLDDVDRLLTSSGLRTPALRVVKDGTVLPTSRFTRQATMAGSAVTGLVDGRKVLTLFDDGATLVLQGLHRYWPPLTELVRRLEVELGHPCQANAYLTPAGSQGFARHTDTHDVFVFQTHGHKHWQIVEDGQERDVVLEPGRSMYLPTGTPHSARAEDETSLHVTVGINRLTWRDVLLDLARTVLAQAAYDAPLPAGYPADPGPFAAALADRLTAFSGSLSGVDPATAAGERVSTFLQDRTPALRGGLLDLEALPRLDDETVLERRPTAACVLRPDGDRLTVLLGDRALHMPGRLADPMRFVAERRLFRVGDLAPWLDPQSRHLVCRRLVREGLLQVSGR